MAPELFDDRPQFSERTDLYALDELRRIANRLRPAP
jgi:hypothetical protein